MDKYLITSFRDEIANAILNSQDKLNPNKDAYIDKDEIKGIEDFFGKKISELLKPQNNQSVFNNNTTNSSENNQDTVEISNSKDNKDEDDAISTYGTAANELNSKVKTNLSLTSAGKTHNNQMESLMAQKTLKSGYKIDALNNLVLDYMREHPDVDQEHL